MNTKRGTVALTALAALFSLGIQQADDRTIWLSQAVQWTGKRIS